MQLEASDWLGARETLQRILAPDAGRKGTALDAAERMALASMFSRLGERSSVLALLAEGGAAADTEELEARAELFAASGEVGTAERIVGEVLSSQDSVRALVLGAALAELGGRSKDAEAILERLDRTTPDPLARERQRAEHYLRVGTLARAEEHQRRLVSLPGALAGDWRALLACLVAQGKEPEVAAVLDRTRSLGVALARDNEAPLLTDDLLLASRQPELRALGVAYVQDARQRALAGQALQLLGAAPHRAFTALERERLRSLAQQAPRFLVLQMTLADGLMRRRDLEEAVALLKATSIAFPMALEPLRTLAYCERALGRKDRAIEAAKRWRERAAGLAVEPDHFLAQLATPEEAAALLEPHLGVAVARGMQEVLELYGRSRILRGEQGRVRQVFEPWLLAGERTAVAAWGALAGFLAARGESALAIDWLQRDAVTAVVARDGAARIEVAGAWMVVAQASQSESARETALALVRELPESSVLGADDWEKLGQVYESGNDQAAAERAYRKALASPARPLIALNNLCMILGRSGRASEALPLAKELVLRGPDVPEYRDTLATLHQLANELDAALEQLEHSLRLDPTDVRWAVRLLEVLLAQGNRQEAERRLGEFKSRYPEAKMTPERLASWATIVRAVEGEAGAAR